VAATLPPVDTPLWHEVHVLSPGAPVLLAGGCGNAIIKSGIASKFPPSWIGLLSARLARHHSGTRISQSPADLCVPPRRAARLERNCSSVGAWLPPARAC